tara:strand:- start:227 stop:514 length:288 start_codon:yes stop_codon:yes gene_type:complete
MKHSVLLDTSFFIRLLNDGDPLHLNAIDYFKHFAENEITMKVSTISIAEYCVKGTVDELPLKKLQILPFNFLTLVKRLANLPKAFSIRKGFLGMS